MTQAKKTGSTPRIPSAYGGIQVNYCKNPACANFGVDPLPVVSKGAPNASSIRDTYRLSGAGLRFPVIGCLLCGEMPPLKSNQGVDEEFQRIFSFHKQKSVCCPDENCGNQHVPITTGKIAYSSFGTSTGSSKRYLCKVCKKTFSVKTKATIRQRIPEKNAEILRLLVNKVAMRRICEIANISSEMLYQRISFFQSCANALTAHYEKPLLEGRFPLKRLYLSTDRQEYVLNWSKHDDKRNIALHAAGTADNDSGYVFCMALNFDSSCNAELIEAEAVSNGDYAKPSPHRRYARLWLSGDYKNAALKHKKRPLKGSSDLSDAVSHAYETALDREDIERSEEMSLNEQLPIKGMQVHSEYTLYGHFFYLRRLLSSVEKVRFFVDQDSPMRAGAINGFKDLIKERKADVFFVSLSKNRTINEKRALVKKSKDALEAAKIDNPGLSDEEVEIKLIKDELGRLATIGVWKDRWLIMPFPKMNEPEKAICHLTDFKDYDDDHLARLYRKASLHGIDRFFMVVRRRLSLLERPISTSSSGGRTWFGYSSYNPSHVASVLDIFRTYYNYCFLGDGAKETAAMKLGLCDHRITDEEFLTFF